MRSNLECLICEAADDARDDPSREANRRRNRVEFCLFGRALPDARIRTLGADGEPQTDLPPHTLH